MGTITPNMSLQKPTLAGDAGTWDDQINASFDLLDLHDHSIGKGVRVPTAGLNINADLPMGGFGVSQAKYVQLFNQASSPGVSKSFWVKTSDGELYWRNGAGVDVKFTSGNTLNLSLVGGITGDYAAASASFYYDDANKTYRALRQAPLPNFWASLSAGDLDLYEKASGITNRVRLKSPAALAASYDFTLPTALPGANAILQSSSTGALGYNSTSNRAAIGATTLDASGAVTFSSTLVVTSTVTASDFKQTTARVTKIPALACNFFGSGVSLAADMSYVDMGTGTASVGAAFPLIIDQGEQVTQCVAKANKTSTSGTLSFRFRKFNHSTSVLTTIGSATNAANNPGQISLTISGLAETIASGISYWFEFSRSTAVAGDLIEDIEVSHTRP